MISLICKHCSKVFEVKPYRQYTAICCSRACLWFVTKDQREKHRLKAIRGKKAVNNNEIKHRCKHCNKVFYDSPSVKRKYCSKFCINKKSKSTWKAVFSTVRKNMIRRGLLKKCQLCGYDKHKEIIGVHHIDSNRHNNSITNLMVLCPTCHSIQHMKHIVH